MILFLCLLALAAAKPQVHESTTDGDNAEFLHSTNDFIPQQDITQHETQNIDNHVIQPRSCFPIYQCENINTNTENIPKQSFSYNDITNLRQAQNSPVNMLQHFQTVHQHSNPIQQIQQQCLQQHQIEILQKQYQTQKLLLKQYQDALNQAYQPQTCIQTEYIPPPKILSSTQWTTPLQNMDISSSGMIDQLNIEPTGGVNTEFIPGTSFNLGSCQVTPLYAITCVGNA